MKDLKVLITAGPTHEPIDAVRYLANRSSGQVGLALAEAAHRREARVCLLLGPVCMAAPGHHEVHRFETVSDLQTLLEAHFESCDVLIMAAAVADYRIKGPSPTKWPRGTGPLTLELEATPDLVAACARRKRAGQTLVGFALEDFPLLEHRAGQKLISKQLDAIVANPLKTMNSGEIDPILQSPGREPLRPGPMSKVRFADWLLDWIEEIRK